MKFKNIYHILFAVSILAMSACTESDDEPVNDTPPEGALPSAEFTPNNLPDEPYAEDAIRIVATNEDAPFYAIELMPDGHYLLSTSRPYDYRTASVHVASKADGGFSISKKRKNKTSRARSVEDNNGTLELPNGEYYGEFTKLGDKKYRLSNGDEIDLKDVTGSDKKVSYRRMDGWVSNVYVFVSEPIMESRTKSLCRAWDYNSFELWAYWNNKYIFHGKQTLNNGVVDSYFKVIGGGLFEQEDFIDDEFCYKIIFTSVGTYICFYLDGDVDVSQWDWKDEWQGTLYYDHSTGDVYEGDGFVTVRFAGNQMRIYEDYTDSEKDENIRMVIVNTLTAAN